MQRFAWFYPDLSADELPAATLDLLARARRLHLTGLYVMAPERDLLTRPAIAQEFLRRCAGEGIEAHLGLLPFTEPPDPTPEMLRRRYVYEEDGQHRPQNLCPAWPENRLLAAHRAQVLLETLQPPALHLDFIRYRFANCRALGEDLEWEEGGKWLDTYHHCQCPLCQTDRLELLGREPTIWDERHPGYVYHQLRQREAHIRETLQSIREVCRQTGVRLSAAVRSLYLGRAVIEGQDWVAWCREGLVEVCSPMNYSPDPAVVARRLAENRRLLPESRAQWVEGLAWHSSAGQATPQALVDQVQVVQAAGVEGVALFHLGALSDEVESQLAEIW
jgi:hypothetical protein